MNFKNKEIEKLLKKYIENRYSPEEFSALINYFETSDDGLLFDEIAFDQWVEINEKFCQPDEVKSVELKKEALNIIRNQKEISNSANNKILLSFARIAAMILLLISLPIITYYGWKTFTNKKQVEEYIATIIKTGKKQDLILADGTQVMMNSESKLISPKKFQGKTRKITLQGEAFFKVTHDKSNPFIVTSDKVTVKVLGTSFNVKDYRNDEYVYITVTTGKVAVFIGGQKSNILLMPNEQLVINKATGSYQKLIVNADKYNMWTKGALYFKSTPISEVVKTISRWYGKDIVLKDTIDNHFISGEHDNKSLEAVLEAINFSTGLKYKQINNQIILFK